MSRLAPLLLLPLLGCPDQKMDSGTPPSDSQEGPADEPSVDITAPVSGTVVAADTALVFSAQVSDAQSPESVLQYDWSSSLDGPLATQTTLKSTAAWFSVPSGLSAGEHELQLVVTDPDGDAGSDSVTVTAE